MDGTIFDAYFQAAYSGNLPEDFSLYEAREGDNPMADHEHSTIMHVAAKAGHLPSYMEDEDREEWEWTADDGYTVRDAWDEYIEDSRQF
jgi:hypothetical protein